MSKPTVFLSSSREGLDVAHELAAQLESSATTTLWAEGAFRPGQTIVESLTEAADRSDFAVFVLTADDALSRGGHALRVPRSNVLFELGFLTGRIGLERTFLVVADPGSVELPSDLAGVMYVPLALPSSSETPKRVAPAAAVVRRAIADIGPRLSERPQFSSCFISYSWHDKDFAAQLHSDLEKVGVRCWLDAKDLQAGRRISEQIDRAIQAHDKVLLVLSEASVNSDWVRAEIRNASRLERARQTPVLFPVRLDDSVLKEQGAEEIVDLRERYIIDFRAWHDKQQYRRSFAKLVRDLAISTSLESERRG